MPQIAFVTGADRGLGLALCKGLLDLGWQVYAGQFMPEWPDLGALAEAYPGRLVCLPLNVGDQASVQAVAGTVAASVAHVDLLINNAGISARGPAFGEGIDYQSMLQAFSVNSVGPLRMVEAFLPLLDAGDTKRICFVSSEAGCQALVHRQDGFGYCMSKKALNMGVKNLFNELRPEGYTFRLYHPGWMRTYMGGAKSTHGNLEPEESAAFAVPFFVGEREDEDRLVMIDYMGYEWPF
jgi:NAD(P)-dependent dehydrogenase (short-subunit alcohol dehydrogenase family)